MESKVSSKQRVQFDFTSEAIQRIDDMKEKAGASTRAEVVRDALRLYEWFVSRVDPKYIVEVKDQDDQTVFRITAEMLLS